jgi:hypothetical protein
MHPRRGHDLKFEELFVSTACVVCMLCVHRVFSTHVWRAVHPCSNSPALRVPAEGVDRGGIQGSDSLFPFGVTPPALRA